MSDDVSMNALSGSIAERTRASLAAGCDVVLHCNGKLDEMREVAARDAGAGGRGAGARGCGAGVAQAAAAVRSRGGARANSTRLIGAGRSTA